mmetsp:Transcript_2580/g.9873  ORF Transcript_2580/g.9873 Transcript_2580/m.9873 type:complete len:112 (+) Transcript_2580:59-394(+)
MKVPHYQLCYVSFELFRLSEWSRSTFVCLGRALIHYCGTHSSFIVLNHDNNDCSKFAALSLEMNQSHRHVLFTPPPAPCFLDNVSLCHCVFHKNSFIIHILALNPTAFSAT